MPFYTFPDSLECSQCTSPSLAGSAGLERRGRENPGPVTQASLHSPPTAEGNGQGGLMLTTTVCRPREGSDVNYNCVQTQRRQWTGRFNSSCNCMQTQQNWWTGKLDANCVQSQRRQWTGRFNSSCNCVQTQQTWWTGKLDAKCVQSQRR